MIKVNNRTYQIDERIITSANIVICIISDTETRDRFLYKRVVDVVPTDMYGWLDVEAEQDFSEWSLYSDTKLAELQKPKKTLTDFKREKSNEISLMCRAQIYAGYTSNALGTPHHYPNKDRDQANMIASVTDSYNPTNPPTWTTLFWCYDENGVWELRHHTAEQIRQVGSDGKAAINEALVKNAALQVQIEEATNEAELVQITW